MNLLQALELVKEPNYTTLDQSKHLLDLGLPPDSADSYFGKDGQVRYIDGSIPRSILWADSYTPCWSVGQLIKIYLIYEKALESCIQICLTILLKEN